MLEGLYYFCWRKKQFIKRKEARRVAKLMTNKYLVKFNAYKCTICIHYHVGRSYKTEKANKCIT